MKQTKKVKLKPFQCIICSTDDNLKLFTSDTNLVFHHMTHSMLELSQALVDTQKTLRTIFSAGQNKHYKHYFMKCQLQMGIAQYKNAATSLATICINTTQQHFQMRYVTLF